MNLSFKSVVVGILVCLFAASSAFFSVLGEIGVALAFSIISSLLLLYEVRLLTGNFTNIAMIFVIFSALYGLSGPITVEWGEGLSAIFPRPFHTEIFLLHYSLAVVGLSSGFLLIASNGKTDGEKLVALNLRRSAMQKTAFALAIIASLMEMINFLRVGGFGTLLAGKASYQSAVSNLTGTLPSVNMLILSIAFLGLSFAVETAFFRKTRGKFLIWIILSAPVWMIFIILGRRGSLLRVFLIFFVAASFFKPIKKIKRKWVVVFLSVYVALAFLGGIRSNLAFSLATGNWDIVSRRISQLGFWIQALNPGTNEFGAAFGNFNTYVLSGDSELMFGETYLKGMTVPIPRFVWPNKPETATYEFRDKYFPHEAKRGAIAGTAYSSILEAYVNFGTFGVLVVYVIVALALGWLENQRKRAKSLWFCVFYLMILPEAVRFHRSSLEMPLFWPLVLTVFGISVYLLVDAVVFSLKAKKQGRSLTNSMT